MKRFKETYSCSKEGSVAEWFKVLTRNPEVLSFLIFYPPATLVCITFLPGYLPVGVLTLMIYCVWHGTEKALPGSCFKNFFPIACWLLGVEY